MPDYNIFIHTNNEGGMSNKTKPWANQENGGGENGANAFTVGTNVINGASSFASSGFTPYAETGVSQLSKVAPAIALGVTVAKLADKVMTTGFNHLETYTGHYEYSLELNNFKTALHNVMNPIGTFMKVLHRQYQFKLQNQRLDQERTLVGNSILSTSVKGV